MIVQAQSKNISLAAMRATWATNTYPGDTPIKKIELFQDMKLRRIKGKLVEVLIHKECEMVVKAQTKVR